MIKNLYGGNVIVSSENMGQMADQIVGVLNAKKPSFSHIPMKYTRFANGEIKPFVPETVRGMHAILLQDLQFPDPNIALIEMLLTADALKRASVNGITLVLPYIPYLRQDRKDKPRVPISARMIADMIEINKAITRVITLEMHVQQEQGFFSIPVDNINATKVHALYFKEKFKNNFTDVVVVAPDFGSAVRAENFARLLGCDVPVSIFQKRRSCPNQAEVVGFVGATVTNKTVIIYDDMIDTGGTISSAAMEILNQGAVKIYICATHGIFSRDAESRFKNADQSVIITPTIPRSNEYWAKNASWLEFVPITDLLAKAIYEASIVGGSFSQL